MHGNIQTQWENEFNYMDNTNNELAISCEDLIPNTHNAQCLNMHKLIQITHLFYKVP